MKTITVVILLSFLPFLLNCQNIVIVSKNNITNENAIEEAYRLVIESLEKGIPMSGLFDKFYAFKDLWFQIELLKFANYIPRDFYNRELLPTVILNNTNSDSSVFTLHTFGKLENGELTPYLQMKIDFNPINYKFKDFKVFKGMEILAFDEKTILNLNKKPYSNGGELPPPPISPSETNSSRKKGSNKSIFERKMNLAFQKKKLVIYDEYITEIPFERFDSLKIESFTIAAENLKEIPTKLFEMDALEELTIACSKCKSLPDQFQKLTCLKLLELNTVNIEKIPTSIGNLSELKELTLNVKSKAIPNSISNLKSLKSLNLIADSLTFIPASIGKIKNLTRLEIGRIGYNKINNNINFEGILDSVKNLTINHIKLESTKYFPNLAFLWIRNCNMPDDVFEGSVNKALEHLIFADNKLNSIPKSLFDLQNLEILRIRGNTVKTFPKAESFLKLTKLKELSISDFSLTKEMREELKKELSKVPGLRLSL